MAKRIGRALVINPGSAGDPRDPNNDFQVSYAVLDTVTEEVTFDSFPDPQRPVIPKVGVGHYDRRCDADA